MKIPFIPVGAVALFSLAFTSCTEENPEGEASTEPGDAFIELFNGENLDGWTPSKEAPESFSVKDGKLIVKGGKSHLFYSGEVEGADFTDFHLKVRAMTKPGANSGVYFHTAYQEEGWPIKGYECQVNATHKDPKKTGSLYGVKNITVPDTSKKSQGSGDHDVRDAAPNTDNEWFDYDIIVQGKQITIKVDGEVTVDYTEPEGGPGVKNSPERKLDSGTFAIQAHDPDSIVHYERIAVKPL
ncbi:MAG: DUF1080 domain-containing protein [Verrucomicrobiota bacterium]